MGTEHLHFLDRASPTLEGHRYFLVLQVLAVFSCLGNQQLPKIFLVRWQLATLLLRLVRPSKTRKRRILLKPNPQLRSRHYFSLFLRVFSVSNLPKTLFRRNPVAAFNLEPSPQNNHLLWAANPPSPLATYRQNKQAHRSLKNLLPSLQ